MVILYSTSFMRIAEADEYLLVLSYFSASFASPLTGSIKCFKTPCHMPAGVSHQEDNLSGLGSTVLSYRKNTLDCVSLTTLRLDLHGLRKLSFFPNSSSRKDGERVGLGLVRSLSRESIILTSWTDVVTYP